MKVKNVLGWVLSALIAAGIVVPAEILIQDDPIKRAVVIAGLTFIIILLGCATLYKRPQRYTRAETIAKDLSKPPDPMPGDEKVYFHGMLTLLGAYLFLGRGYILWMVVTVLRHLSLPHG